MPDPSSTDPTSTDPSTTDTDPAEPGEVDTYGITLPNQWSTIPLDRNEQLAAKAELIAELETRDGWTPTMGRRIDLSIAQLNGALSRVNATLAAVFWDVWADQAAIDDSTDTPGGEFISASCTLGTLSRADLDTTFGLTPGLLLGAVSASRPSGVANDPSEGVDLEPPTLVSLHPGKAVRLRRHHSHRIDLGSTQGVFAETYLVPHGGDATKMCVLSFGTMNEDLAPELSPLFEKIAGTLRFFRPGQETTEIAWGEPATS